MEKGILWPSLEIRTVWVNDGLETRGVAGEDSQPSKQEVYKLPKISSSYFRFQDIVCVIQLVFPLHCIKRKKQTPFQQYTIPVSQIYSQFSLMASHLSFKVCIKYDINRHTTWVAPVSALRFVWSNATLQHTSLLRAVTRTKPRHTDPTCTVPLSWKCAQFVWMRQICIHHPPTLYPWLGSVYFSAHHVHVIWCHTLQMV